MSARDEGNAAARAALSSARRLAQLDRLGGVRVHDAWFGLCTAQVFAAEVRRNADPIVTQGAVNEIRFLHRNYSRRSV